MFNIKQCRQYIKIYKSKNLQHFMLVLLMGGFHISWVKKSYRTAILTISLQKKKKKAVVLYQRWCVYDGNGMQTINLNKSHFHLDELKAATFKKTSEIC